MLAVVDTEGSTDGDGEGLGDGDGATEMSGAPGKYKSDDAIYELVSLGLLHRK